MLEAILIFFCMFFSMWCLYLIFYLFNKPLFDNKHIIINLCIILVSFIASFSYFFVDKNLSYYFHNTLLLYPALKQAIKLFTEIGHFYGTLVIVCLYLSFERFYFNISVDDIKAKAIALLKALILSGIFVNILKSIYGRARPIELFNNNNYDFYPLQTINLIESFFKTSTTDVDNIIIHNGYAFASFPSGHSISALVIFSFLAFAYKKYSIFFFSFGLSVAFSRVMLTQHFLSDVLIGSLLGFGFAYYFFHTIEQRKVK